ncbi:unnamed protein product [Bemisia tabaci]|uniref:ABC transporter domain-containing protein n=1 Tax=Bemisia tabaci TaxID=7038 RepID=A0A9P0ACP6_BEMTA|nr:unnamed protein product [Bemisia tabaci]
MGDEQKEKEKDPKMRRVSTVTFRPEVHEVVEWRVSEESESEDEEENLGDFDEALEMGSILRNNNNTVPILNTSRKPGLNRIPTRAEMKTLTHKAKRPAVDIEFQNLNFTAQSSAHGKKHILRQINGLFKAGELTAIMGPSGAGKSSLMNILVGYVTANTSGSILTNGSPRQMNLFNKLCSYIMQDDLLQPHLTVLESLIISAHLKLGNELPIEDKLSVVDEIIETLGLQVCRNTRVEGLSGGQRKRLSVALELVSNPPVLFLDEPTTGLDLVATKQCVGVLKSLAQQGRTIVCTIHQPSASIFETFDHVYMLAKGQCIYQGAPTQLVPFLANIGLHCKATYNPADFVFEILDTENIKRMTHEIANGKLSQPDPNTTETPAVTKLCRRETMAVIPQVSVTDEEVKKSVEFPTSFWTQFSILLKRRLLQNSRNKTSLYIQSLHHLFSGIFLGGIFLGVGNDAARPFENFKFCISVIVFFIYTYVMTPVLLFPYEVKLLRREYFNRWYSLKAFYAAMSIASLPTTILFGTMFSVVTYLMSDQPWNSDRFIWYLFIGQAMALVSEGMGILIGSIFKSTNGAAVAPASLAPLLAVAVYGMGFGSVIEPFMQFLMNLSFIRYGLVALSVTLYQNRPLMECKESELYCHYKNPRLLLRDLGMEDIDRTNEMISLSVFIVLFRIAAFSALRYRLTTEFSSKFMRIINKVLRKK